LQIFLVAIGADFFIVGGGSVGEPKLELVLQTGHARAITSVAMSADGRRLLTGSQDEGAILWDTGSGQMLRTFQWHAGGFTSVALNSDGSRVLAGSSDGSAILWQAGTGEKLQIFPAAIVGHQSQVTCVAFSGDGETLLTATSQSVILWDGRTAGKLQ